jgi:hypothetical protein
MPITITGGAERRRRAPRFEVVHYVGVLEPVTLSVTFKDRMDVLLSAATFRIFHASLGVLEFTNFTWANDRTITSETAAVLGAYSGPTYSLYMGGNLRAARRFLLVERARCNRVEVVA